MEQQGDTGENHQRDSEREEVKPETIPEDHTYKIKQAMNRHSNPDVEVHAKTDHSPIFFLAVAFHHLQLKIKISNCNF